MVPHQHLQGCQQMTLALTVLETCMLYLFSLEFHYGNSHLGPSSYPTKASHVMQKKKLPPRTAVIQLYIATKYSLADLSAFGKDEVFITVTSTWISSSFLILSVTLSPADISLLW